MLFREITSRCRHRDGIDHLLGLSKSDYAKLLSEGVIA